MNRLSRTTLLGAAAFALLLLAAQPAQAVCAAPFLVSSLDPATGDYSYVYTPGVNGDGYLNSSVTENLSGVFWHIGNGDPVFGPGNDNGTFGARDGWIRTVPNYAAYVLTTWAADIGIDGCIDTPLDGAPAERCMAIALSDVAPDGSAVFAVVAAADNPTTRDFSFAQPGSAPINLVPVPQAELMNTFREDDQTVRQEIRTPAEADFAAGVYLGDGAACDGIRGSSDGLLIGAQIRTAVVARGEAPPAANDLANWNAVDPQVGPPVTPLDSLTFFTTTCQGNADIYTSYTLVYESGFNAPIISGILGPVDCGPCGNGVLDMGEDCDEGPNNGSGTCPRDCQIATCGDGVAEGDEECDDGNNVDGDGCQANCALPQCGDGIVDAGEGEECDDGNTDDGDGCQGNCLDPVCGDGILDAGEECDDGNNTDGDACSANCEIEACPDDDGDGFGAPGQDNCTGGSAEDCDDTNADTFPGAAEQCDREDNDCDGIVPDDETDEDGDGQADCEGDCDDANADSFTGADEVCDRQDNDCDGVVPADEVDDDGDGFTECEGDCDDGNGETFPGAGETTCDGIDNDCDPETVDDINQDDDPVSFCEGDCDDQNPNNYPGNTEICDGLDNDCNNGPDFPGETGDSDGDGILDCADVEECDFVDNDGDGLIDEDFDVDGDGVTTCAGDCDDNDPNVNPLVVEVCNDGIDNDCDGLVDLDDVEDCEPFLVELEYFNATATRGGVEVAWGTLTEIDTVGFRVLRTRARADIKSNDPQSRYAQLKPITGLIPALGNGLEGHQYLVKDADRQPDGIVLYYLEDVDTSGRRTLHGPVQVTLGSRTAGSKR